MIIFTFSGDAAGSPDPVTLPKEVNGATKLTIIPPPGHAWTLYGLDRATGANMSVDQAKEISRRAQSCFLAGEVPAFVALDTGSGSFTGILE